MIMIDCEVLIYIDQISNRWWLSVCLSQNCYFLSSWAPQARSEAWEIYPRELYPLDDPPRPSRPKASLGLMMMWIMMMTMILMVMMMMMIICCQEEVHILRWRYWGQLHNSRNPRCRLPLPNWCHPLLLWFYYFIYHLLFIFYHNFIIFPIIITVSSLMTMMMMIFNIMIMLGTRQWW